MKTHLHASPIVVKIPDDLKMARIVPLYKKNSKHHNYVVGHYRPISVLICVISKVFEKLVFMQLSDYLSEKYCRLFYEFQSGFRSSYCTDTV